MRLVILTAIGVGGATVIGSLMGFLFGRASNKFINAIFFVASALMLFAAIGGLILPAYEYENKRVGVTIFMLVGAMCLFLTDKLLPIIQKKGSEYSGNHRKIARAWLLILAIGIHNFPEGIAAGVGFGSGDSGKALLIAGGIALQNIPEGMIVVFPMLDSGMSRKKTFFLSLLTGGMEVLGTMIGYFAVNIESGILPYVLAFAGGTMLYVIAEESLEHINPKKL